jgi:predicted Zn-dependent peptidase
MVEITKLSNGITVLLENIDFYSSASAGIYVNTGSRHELPQEAGISHFIEHMLFKGTKTRTAQDIARQFDRIGGQANAYTSKENTVFYAKTMSCHVVEALDILAIWFELKVCQEGHYKRTRGCLRGNQHGGGLAGRPRRRPAH